MGQQPHAAPLSGNQPSGTQPSSAQSSNPLPANPLTPAEFAARLGAFNLVVDACQAAPSPEHCPASQVNSTLELQLPSGTRSVSFLWLRAVLSEAAHPESEAESSSAKAEKLSQNQKKDKNSPKKEKSDQKKDESDPEDDESGLQIDQIPSIHDRLAAASQRLAAEKAQILVTQPATEPASSSRNSASRRSALAAILAGKDYHSINPDRTLRQRLLEKIQKWLLRFFTAIADAGRGKHWIGIVAEAVFVVLLLLALAWFLIRLERQGRFTNAGLARGQGAASARDWQLWLEDAQKAAARQAWRDAVHYLYWSAISRMESSGLWPADRARTPREYLALLAPTHAQRPALMALTRTFERTWYAGHPASEADFRQAEQQASQLSTRRAHPQDPQQQDSQQHDPRQQDAGREDLQNPGKAGLQ